ncbi:MAG TPA: PAS domain S-box protein [Ignavibacteriales bacterium]|nr:PAS domain S-box protein [Ignavibacteriales bacterium]
MISKTLLLVEDEAIIALTEKRWLINEGFRVIHVTSGEEAIKTVQTGSEKIDLILMDIDLGHGCMDGTQAAREILKTQDIPLLFLSSHTEKEIVDKTEQITSYGYVVKGSTDTVLLASIKMAFKLYKANQEIKAREEALKEREFWLNASQKVAKIGSYRADFQADIWSSSSVLSEIFGIDEQYTRSVAGWLNLVHPEDRDMMNDYLHKVFEGQTQFDKQYRILRPSDGRMFWVHGMGKIDFDKSGNPLIMIGTIQDITERKLMDEALRRSEENLSTTLHSIGDGVIATDSKGNIVRMNPAAEGLCGWAFNEAEGKPLSEVFHIINAESRKEVENPVERVLETGQIVGLANHTVLVARDGKEYQIADSAAPISNKTGEITGVVLVFSDVTEEYKIQAALRDSEEQLRLLVSKMEQGLALHEIILDDCGIPKDYRFLDVNESFERLTGLRRESIIGKTVLEVMPGTENYWIEKYGQVALNGLPVSFEDYSKELGKYYSITAYSPRPLQFAVIISDITKRRKDNEPHILSITKDISYKKELENEFKKAKELYLKIFDDFPALIWRAGTDKLCNYFNRTWLEFTGRTLEQEKGNGWAEGVHPDDFSACLDTYLNAFDKREAFSMEYRLKNAAGEYRWIRDFGRPFFDLDNSFLGYIGSCYDITVNKQNEELIIESNAAKDRLLSIVAHDLRGPFSGFIGLSKALATQIDTLSKEDISEFGSAIYMTANKLYDLLNNLLEWSRLQSGKVYFEPAEFLLFREVENIKDLFSSTASDKSLSIINEVESDTAVYADKKMLSTVLGNLTSNAVKFTPAGGKITISAKAEDDFVRVSVSDTGVGMTEEKLAKAFKIDSVFTTKGTNGETGTGFGLLLCKEMVEKNGGKIFINSSLENGSEFIFTIPAASRRRMILDN